MNAVLHSPHLKFIAEPLNRTIHKPIPSVLQERNVPSRFWAEVVAVLVYACSRVASKALSWTNPVLSCGMGVNQISDTHLFLTVGAGTCHQSMHGVAVLSVGS